MMIHDEISLRPPVVDLMYPSHEKRDELRKRGAQLSRLPQDYAENLELGRIAELISPHNVYRVMNMFKQLCCDEEVLEYRLDVLEDFMNIPKLSSTVKKVIEIIVSSDRSSIYKLSEPDSFTKLDDAVSAFEAYVDCVEIMHEFYESSKEKIRSEGVKKLFDYFEESRADKHFVKLSEKVKKLRDAIRGRIRSVTVAINLDERLTPISAGIVEYSSEAYQLKPSLIDRIIYHGAKFPEKTVMADLRRRYSENEFSEKEIVNTVDETLFEELDFLTEGYVNMLDSTLKEYQKLSFEETYDLEYQLEFYAGAANLIDVCRSSGLGMCRPKYLPMSRRRAEISGLYDLIYSRECSIWNARHKDKKTVVTNDIAFDDTARFFLLTGANNGGKTTFLRAVGICQVLAQMGLYVPAVSCEISPVDFIYTHFPKTEQIGINASRFTTEIKEFKTISDTVTSRSMLLMNESIQSTTPQECADIAGELVKIFCRIGVRGIFATHIVELARRVDELNVTDVRSRIESIVAAVDEQTGERIYKIKKSEPYVTSRALSVFKEFGIDYDEISRRLEKE